MVEGLRSELDRFVKFISREPADVLTNLEEPLRRLSDEGTRIGLVIGQHLITSGTQSDFGPTIRNLSVITEAIEGKNVYNVFSMADILSPRVLELIHKNPNWEPNELDIILGILRTGYITDIFIPHSLELSEVGSAILNTTLEQNIQHHYWENLK